MCFPLNAAWSPTMNLNNVNEAVTASHIRMASVDLRRMVDQARGNTSRAVLSRSAHSLLGSLAEAMPGIYCRAVSGGSSYQGAAMAKADQL